MKVDTAAAEERLDIEDICPLSPMQEAMFYQHVLDPADMRYREQSILRLRGPMDAAVLSRAASRVAARRDALRASFLHEGLKAPVQLIMAGHEVPVAYRDASGRGAEGARAFAAMAAREELERGFALSRGPLIRLALVKTSEEEFTLIITFHHIVMDGWSLGLLFGDLFEAYAAEAAGREPAWRSVAQFADYLAWLGDRPRDGAESFWKAYMDGARPQPPLFSRSALGSYGGVGGRTRRQAGLGAELGRAVRQGARSCRCTVASVVKALWGAMLAALTGCDDVVYGFVTSGRPPAVPGIETAIGCFLATVPVRVRLDDAPSFRALAARVQESALACEDMSFLPLSSMTGNSIPPFDHLVVFENYPRIEGGTGPIRVESVEGIERAPYPLNIVFGDDEELSLTVAYDDERYRESDIDAIFRAYRALAAAFAADPDGEARLGADAGAKRRGGEPSPEAARSPVPDEWNATAAPYPAERCVHGLFEDRVRLSPDATALVFGEERISYAQLNARANRLAHRLIAMGVGPDGLVAVCADRSVELVVGLLGTLKAGGAYVPLDPGYPAERLRYMLADSGPVAVLSLGGKADGLGASVPVIDLSLDVREGPSGDPVVAGLGPGNLAYVLYTSGSTGRPKGVMIEHRNLVNHMAWMGRAFPLGPSDSVVQKTPISFDASVWEFYAPLLAGSPLVLAPPGAHREPEALAGLLAREGVHTLQGVPSLVAELLETRAIRNCPGLKRVFCGGEALSPRLRDRFFEVLPDASLVNLYGPTEATIDAVYWECGNDGGRVPIGRPISNTRAYVLDEGARPVPIGAVGELYIAGAGVGRGYLNRPELTAERFLPDAFGGEPGARMYKTGDMCRWLPDGTIEFIGRGDFQVKLRGFRIELGEIEARILAQGGMRECAVVAKRGPTGDPWLCAYALAEAPGGAFDAGPALSRLRDELPDYMVPARLVVLDAFPRTANGKVDRLALAARQEAERAHGARSAPRDAVEERVFAAALGALGLKREALGMEDDFFEAGGDSLKAIRFFSLLGAGALFGIQDVYECRTLERMAGRLKEREDGLAGAALRGMRPALPSLGAMGRAARGALGYWAGRWPRPAARSGAAAGDGPILLTGATGWVGIHLLERFLSSSGRELVALVRGADEPDARARLERAYEHSMGQPLPEAWKPRLTVLPGDIRAEGLGVGQTYGELCEEIACVVHSAAMVRHYGPWEGFFETNVRPVERLVEFCARGRRKDFHLVSTLSVAAGLEPGEALFSEDSGRFSREAANPYVRSKILAEDLARSAAEGGARVWIHRLGNVVFDSRSGVFQRNVDESAFYRTLRSFMALGAIPDLPFSGFDFSYADTTAAAVAALTLSSAPGTYHIRNPRKVSYGRLGALLGAAGARVRTLDPGRFLALAREALRDPALADEGAAVLANFSAAEPRLLVTLDGRSRARLSSLKIRWPELDRRLAAAMISHGTERKFFPSNKGEGR